MRTNVYMINVACPVLKTELAKRERPIQWRMVAHNKESAWNKFCRQYFNVWLPSQDDYSVELREYQVELI